MLLAPMEDVSDPPFRALCKENGADVVYTEFISSEGLIRDAAKSIDNYRLNECSMYVTLEPCHMCAKAAVDARISSIIFAALEPKTGSLISIDNFFDKKELNHNPSYQFGLLKDESSKLLKDFFRPVSYTHLTLPTKA